jgi:hypothetical protein
MVIAIMSSVIPADDHNLAAAVVAITAAGHAAGQTH